MARTFTKNLANHLSLGVNTIGPIINGASSVLVIAQIRPSSYDVSAGDNQLVNIPIGGGIGIQVNVNGLAGINVLRGLGRSQSTDTDQINDAATAITTATWHTVGVLFSYSTDQIFVYLDGAQDGAASPVTFGSLTYVNNNPVTADRIGRSGNAQTNQQFAGDIEYAGVWENVSSAQAAAIISAVHSGSTHPLDATPSPTFLMVLGYQTPDVDLVGGTIQSTITGSLPFVQGLVGLPGSSVDQVAEAGSISSGTSATTPAVTTTFAPELLFGAVAIPFKNIVITQDPDFQTSVAGAETDDAGQTSNPIKIFIGDRIISATETQNYGVTFDANTGWAIGLVTYKALADGGTPLPQITSVLEYQVAANAPLFYLAEASNNPISFTALNLPAGTTFEDTGELGGSITTPGIYNIDLAAINETGTGPTKTLILTVVAAAAGAGVKHYNAYQGALIASTIGAF